MKKTRLAKCFQWALNILAALLILFALILTLSRISVLVIAHQRGYMEKWLSGELKESVQIQSIKADWADLNPGITVNDILLKNVKINRLRVTIDLFRSLIHWKLLPKHLTVEGVNLEIDDTQGHLQVRGPLSDQVTKFASLVNWMLAEGNLSVSNVNINYHAKDKKTYFLRHLHLQVVNNFFTHRVSGGAFVNRVSPTEIQFVAELNGIDFLDAKFNANFYILLKHVQLNQWANSSFFKRYIQSAKIDEGDASLALWGQWKKTKIVSLQGHWRIKNAMFELPTKHWVDINDMLGIFNWDPSDNHLDLQIDHIRVSLPEDYWSSLLFRQIRARVNWGKDDSGFYITVPHYQFAILSFKSQGQFNLHIPNEGKPTLDFISTNHFTKFSQLPALLPDRHRSPALHRWLKQASFRGGVSAATVVYRGPIEAAPFKNHDGHLEAELQIDHAGLSYQAGWPALTSMNGVIEVRDRHVSATFPGAYIGTNPIKTLNFSLDDFQVPKLNIESVILTNFSNLYQFAQHSPVAFTKGPKTAPVKGPVALKIQMQIDFSRPFFLVQSKGEASVIGSTTAFEVKTNGSKVHVGFDGILNLDSMRSQWSLELLKGIQGKTRYKATIDIDKQQGTQLNFTSDMKGVQISGFPDFINKSAKKPSPILFHVEIPHDKPIKIALHYQKNILVRLLASRQGGYTKFTSGEIYVGKNPSPHYPVFPGFVVHGDIPSFHWLKWKPIILPFVHEKDGAIEIPELFGLPLRYVEFNFGNMEAFHHKIVNIKIKLIPRPHDWMFQLKNQELAGTVFIPNYSGGTWAGRIDYLSLPKIKRDKAKKKHKPVYIDPSKIPPIDFVIKKLLYDHTNYGWVEIRTRPNRHGITINQISVKSPLVALSLQGKWEQNQSHHQSTMLKGYFQTKNLGQLLSNWDINNVISDGRGQATFHLFWPDSINQIDPDILSGSISFKFRHGRILKMDKKKMKELSLGRLVNAFSLEELPRRLSLHFGDITAKGLEFHLLKGTLNLKRGKGKVKDVILDGPVAKLKINGDINFRAKNYNLKVAVAPYVTSSVPLIVGVVGGPIAGVIAWVANKIAAPEIGKAIGFVYHAKGSWDKSKLLALPQPKGTHDRSHKNS